MPTSNQTSRFSWRRLAATVLAVCAAVLPVRAQKPKAPVADSFATVNVCERVPGEEVASSLKGKLIDVRPVNIAGFDAARCLYGIDLGDARQTFVLWFNPVADYDGLRKAASGLVKALADIGDAAHLTTDADTKRVIITAMKRGRVTIQVTGEREEWVRTVATLALSKF